MAATVSWLRWHAHCKQDKGSCDICDGTPLSDICVGDRTSAIVPFEQWQGDNRVTDTNLQGLFAASSMGQESVEAVYKPAGNI